jgi:hypothetical protein
MATTWQGPAMTLAPTTRAARRWVGGLGLGLTLCLGACDSILEVNDPDIIVDANSPAGAIALRNGVILRFNQAMDGGGDAPDGMFLLSGLLADEWRSGDTFEQRNTTDFRSVSTTNSFVNDLFRRANRVRIEGEGAIAALRQFTPTDSASIGRMWAYMAFAENQIGEFFCNGIPFSEVSGTDVVPGNPVSDDSAFGRAISHADTALVTAGASTDSAKTRVRNLAALIKGRALLNRDSAAAAALAVAAVPTSFQYRSEHSVTANDNAIWLQAVNLVRYVMADSEGINGLPFVSAADPRLPTFVVGHSFDNIFASVSSPTLWNSRDSAVVVASGVEARLIEAEAALRGGDATTYLAKLNEARAAFNTAHAPPDTLPVLTDPGDDASRTTLLFRERAFWMYSTGHRLGDLRRMIRQYGRNAESVFPTGPWFKGGTYGSDVNFPIPFAEQNNPNFTQCADRSA